jgi:6-phosphofructokinase
LQEIDEGSLHIAYYFQKVWGKVVFIPKTIDNDIWGTESIGFDTALNIAMETKEGFCGPGYGEAYGLDSLRNSGSR